MRNIGYFLLGLLSGIVILMMLIHVQIGTPTASSKWAYDLYRAKEQHANLAEGKKILIVAGSNSLFGISTRDIQRKVDMHTTNFGVHAGLGLRYILERSKHSLTRGDIVYLPLEYALYQEDPVPSTQLMDFLLARDPQYLSSLSFFDRIMGYNSVSIKRIIEGLKGGSDKYLGRSSSIYNVANIDPFGDQTNNTVQNATAFENKLNMLDAKDLGSGKISKYSQKLLSEYFTWAERNNVCVIGAPPGLMYFEEYKSPAYLAFFSQITQFYADKNIYFAGNPADYLFSKNLFFDTEYHLNRNGVRVRTERVLRDLQPHPETFCS